MRADVPVLELAWAAGVFEGEGSVRINKPTARNRGALLCDMVNTAPEITAFFADRWGGYHRPIPAAPPRNAYWRWRVAALEAARFLRDVQPYLRTEKYRTRVDLALAFQDQKRRSSGLNRGALYLATQDQYYEQMRDLNVRGVRDDQPAAPAWPAPRPDLTIALFDEADLVPRRVLGLVT
jgi:hypothetical protein